MGYVEYIRDYHPRSVAGNQRRSAIPYGHQFIDEDDVQAVIDVLRSDYITQGPKVREFEEAFADYVDARYAVAVNSGTAALHLACQAAGLGSGDQVITSPISFVASANCALYVGATPAFVDIDPETHNLDPRKLEDYLEGKSENHSPDIHDMGRFPAGRPKAIIPVHFSGLPCDMPEIHRLAEAHHLTVIEDACHALGGAYGMGRGSAENHWIKVGSCRHSHMTAFSFHPVKHITTGEGGMVTTNDRIIYDRLMTLRNHGITHSPDRFVNLHTREVNPGDIPSWYYEMVELGHNYRITDIQAALGLSQIKKADRFILLREEIADGYREGLKDCESLILPANPGSGRSAYHLFTVMIDFQKVGKRRQEIMDSLRESGIGTQVHYIPIPHHPFYRHLGYDEKDYPVAASFYQRCLSLPIFPGLEPWEIERITDALKELL